MRCEQGILQAYRRNAAVAESIVSLRNLTSKRIVTDRIE